jgi:formylglycine-generating enzyme required for sulfatase activity
VGNVREWVGTDWSAPGTGSDKQQAAAPGVADLKVVRGGSYASPVGELRSSARQGLAASNKDKMTGFRILREL